MSERLWICERCELIGSGMQAARHSDATDHPIEQLDEDTSAAVLEEQRKHPPWPEAGDWIAYARFKQRAKGEFGSDPERKRV